MGETVALLANVVMGRVSSFRQAIAVALDSGLEATMQSRPLMPVPHDRGPAA